MRRLLSSDLAREIVELLLWPWRPEGDKFVCSVIARVQQHSTSALSSRAEERVENQHAKSGRFPSSPPPQSRAPQSQVSEANLHIRPRITDTNARITRTQQQRLEAHAQEPGALRRKPQARPQVAGVRARLKANNSYCACVCVCTPPSILDDDDDDE